MNISTILHATFMLSGREIIRFLRQPNRVIGAVGQPILFWLLFSAGLNQTFQLNATSGMSFGGYYLPGTLALIILFSAIFSTISVIEDRREGLLQSVLVSPLPRWAFAVAKIVGGTVLAVGQASVFLALILVFSNEVSWAAVPGIAGLLILMSLGLTALGLLVAWQLESTQGFHAIMNLLLMPMWLLSGAFFPPPALLEGMPASQFTVHWIMKLNPLTYSVSALRTLMFPTHLPENFFSPTLPHALLITTAATTLLCVLAAAQVSRQQKGLSS
jgi:ABC-2 type transport system permease protein